jgi:hypothetical protein
MTPKKSEEEQDKTGDEEESEVTHSLFLEKSFENNSVFGNESIRHEKNSRKNTSSGIKESRQNGVRKRGHRLLIISAVLSMRR